MVKYESDIGGKYSEGPKLRNLDIPDETYEEESRPLPPRRRQEQSFQMPDQRDLNRFAERDDTAELEAQIRAAKLAKRTGRERLSDGAKRRIEMLIGMTRLSRSVKIGENEFVFQTIKTKDLRDAMFEVSKFSETFEFSYEMRKQLLARSLCKVGGLDIEQFLGSEDLDARLAFIDEIDDVIVSRLYDEYLLLDKEAKDKFAIKTEEQRKELTEDLKK